MQYYFNNAKSLEKTGNFSIIFVALLSDNAINVKITNRMARETMAIVVN